VPRNGPERRHFTRRVSVPTEAIETRLRAAMDELRALRQEIADDRPIPALPKDRSSPKHETLVKKKTKP
jgi:hypothetical protein